MANAKYQFTFTNEGDIRYRVGFYQIGYSGAAATIHPSGLGFSLKYEGAQDGIYKSIIPSEVTVELINDYTARQLAQDIIDSEIAEYYLLIEKWSGYGTSYIRYWHGIVNSDNITLPDASTVPPVDILTIVADDGFGYIENILYEPVDSEPQKCALHWFYLAVKSMTGNILIPTNDPFLYVSQMWYESQQSNDPATDDALQDTGFEVKAFQRADEYQVVKGMNLREILHNILSTWNLSIYQHNGRYVVSQMTEYANPDFTAFVYLYNSSLGEFSSHTQTDIWTGYDPLPDRFSGGVFSNLTRSSKVTAQYEYNSSPYGESLLPTPPTPSPIVNNTFTSVTHDCGVTKAGATIHIEGSFAANIVHSGSAGHPGDEFVVRVGFRVMAGALYLKQTFNSDGTITYTWDAAASTIQMPPTAVFALLSNNNITLNNSIALDTESLPSDNESITFEVMYAQIEEVGTFTEWTDPTGGHTLTVTVTFQNDWKMTIGLDGEMLGKMGYYAKNGAGADFTTELDPTIIGDGFQPFNTSHIKVLNGSGSSVNAVEWSKNGTDFYPVHELRCIEMAKGMGQAIRIYEGSFYGEINLLQRHTFDGSTWIWLEGTYYANDYRFDGKLMELSSNYTGITSGELGTADPNGTTSGGGSSVNTAPITDKWQRVDSGGGIYVLSPTTANDSVYAASDTGVAVNGVANTQVGVQGDTVSGVGVNALASGSGAGLHAESATGNHAELGTKIKVLNDHTLQVEADQVFKMGQYVYFKQTLGTNTTNDKRIYCDTSGFHTQTWNGSSWV
ncbi:MAG: hypothetical protein IPH88_17995 [Bacteroidales bacterium]|nr:hypothetical protein [Bacteroidales bacterium]